MFRISVSFVCFLLGALLASCVTSELPDTPQIAALMDGRSPHILSRYGSMKGVRGGRRSLRHTGVDFAGNMGNPILAAASGKVHKIVNVDKCGLGVVLYHPQYNAYTWYCHLSDFADITLDEIVQRGDVIGYIGTSGAASGVPHVHFELRDSSKLDDSGKSSRDPLPYLAACFDNEKNYRVDSEKPLLTPPVAC